VKLYADEDGCEQIRALNAIAVSAIARVEVPAALWRKARTGELGEADAAVLSQEFESDLYGSDDEEPRFAVLALAPVLLDAAASILPTYGLRAYDAVQLASAAAARETDPGCSAFACFDEDLRDCASAVGFALVPD
jgi:predicted nucleic acid-binding protein